MGFLEKARAKLYDERCDPAAYAIAFEIDSDQGLAISRYAQALLDLGRSAEARALRDWLCAFADHMEDPVSRGSLLFEAAYVSRKLGDLDLARELSASGSACLERAEKTCERRYANCERFRAVLDFALDPGRLSPPEIEALYRELDSCRFLSRRTSVEFAWWVAESCYRHGLESAEAEYLRLVASEGEGLALARTARERLRTIDDGDLLAGRGQDHMEKE